MSTTQRFALIGSVSSSSSRRYRRRRLLIEKTLASLRATGLRIA